SRSCCATASRSSSSPTASACPKTSTSPTRAASRAVSRTDRRTRSSTSASWPSASAVDCSRTPKAPESEASSMKQANGLNALAAPVQVIAVAGGKGGVGKTSIAVNLAMTMAMSGKETMLLDADLGLANVDVLLGLQPTHHLGHLLDGHCGIADVVLEA